MEISWGDFLLGSGSAMFFMTFMLKHFLVPSAIREFLKQYAGHSFTEEVGGETYEITITKK